MKFLNDSAWFCMEKLKKHSFETQKAKQKINNTSKHLKITEKKFLTRAL